MYWEELIDQDMEDKMILDIKAEMNDEMDLDEGGACGNGWAWDDVRSKVLDMALVREARLEEVGYMINKGVWKVVDIAEC